MENIKFEIDIVRIERQKTIIAKLLMGLFFNGWLELFTPDL